MLGVSCCCVSACVVTPLHAFQSFKVITAPLHDPAVHCQLCTVVCRHHSTETTTTFNHHQLQFLYTLHRTLQFATDPIGYYKSLSRLPLPNHPQQTITQRFVHFQPIHTSVVSTHSTYHCGAQLTVIRQKFPSWTSKWKTCKSRRTRMRPQW